MKNSYGQIFQDSLIDAIVKVGRFQEVPEGYTLMDIGETTSGMSLPMSGAINILREDTDGDDLLLYYLEKEDICSMTMTC